MKQGPPPALRFLDEAIVEADRARLLRTRPAPRSGLEITFCSNDYLGLAQRMSPASPSGAGASRLVSGERTEHVDLEMASADLVRLPEALAFTSGYAANLGLLSALAGPEDLVVSDALNHASIVDGARLSRARVAIVPHLDLGAVERALAEHTGQRALAEHTGQRALAEHTGQRALAERKARRAFVVTESYFSMDADSLDLAAMRRLCDAHGAALLVDESHALGVLGPEGRGLCAEATASSRTRLSRRSGSRSGREARSWRAAPPLSPGSGTALAVRFVPSPGLSSGPRPARALAGAAEGFGRGSAPSSNHRRDAGRCAAATAASRRPRGARHSRPGLRARSSPGRWSAKPGAGRSGRRPTALREAEGIDVRAIRPSVRARRFGPIACRMTAAPQHVRGPTSSARSMRPSEGRSVAASMNAGRLPDRLGHGDGGIGKTHFSGGASLIRLSSGRTTGRGCPGAGSRSRPEWAGSATGLRTPPAWSALVVST